MDDYSLAECLRVARAHKGWSQTELARRAGLHSVQISKLERGVTREITGSTLRALCKALGVTSDSLLGLDDVDSVQTIADRTAAPLPAKHVAPPPPQSGRRTRKAAAVVA
jgi:transcriptional regulator with XRE-family HTH domain